MRRKHSPSQQYNYHPCDLCGRSVPYGPHRYDLRPTRYGFLCDTCYKANWDGISPALESRLIEKLTAKGEPIPDRMENGLLPPP
ncbi:MAG: hypothetical protein QOG66_2326 [Methylobacteriaceae bacterium]|jgi:hypothetical protein|nr:hypothetical protein [Methylobacteriaceae bacterium]